MIKIFRNGVIILLLSVAMATGLLAAPMSEQQVTTAVETWLRDGLTESRPTAQVRQVEPHLVSGEIVAYIAHLTGGGYCLCGADDILLPVYLYVPQGEYPANDGDIRGILSGMANRLAFVRESSARGGPGLEAYQEDLDQRKQEWSELSSGFVSRRPENDKNRDVPEMLRLSLNSSWHQNDPFNRDCPSLPGEAPSLVGCVATAMAQIMYYWQWPETGMSAHTAVFNYFHTDTWITTPLTVDPGITGDFWVDRLRWTGLDGGNLQLNGSWDSTLRDDALARWNTDGFDAAFTALFNQLTPASENHFANFAATSYNFPAMQDSYADPNSPGAAAVAQLSYHAGISVDMDWGYLGSGTPTAASGPAYENHFRYAPDTVYGALDTDLLMDEIQWLRPVQVRGAGPLGGHSWMVSGYDNFTPYNPYFWMNMGWSTGIIGWFRFDNVPEGFEENNEHITQIAPADVVRFIGPFEDPGADGSPSHPYGNLSSALIETPDNGTIIIKSGTNLVWGPGGVIDRPLTIKGVGVTISVPQ